MMKTRKIGTTFEYEGVLIEVVRDDDCAGCYFFDICGRGQKPEKAGFCSEPNRKDGRAVRFVRIDKFQAINKKIDDLLHEANQMEEACAGKKEEEFYSGMIHGLDLLKEFIKRKFDSRNS